MAVHESRGEQTAAWDMQRVKQTEQSVSEKKVFVNTTAI